MKYISQRNPLLQNLPLKNGSPNGKTVSMPAKLLNHTSVSVTAFATAAKKQGGVAIKIEKMLREKINYLLT